MIPITTKIIPEIKKHKVVETMVGTGRQTNPLRKIFTLFLNYKLFDNHKRRYYYERFGNGRCGLYRLSHFGGIIERGTRRRLRRQSRQQQIRSG